MAAIPVERARGSRRELVKVAPRERPDIKAQGARKALRDAWDRRDSKDSQEDLLEREVLPRLQGSNFSKDFQRGLGE